jgi:hypothetical protein
MNDTPQLPPPPPQGDAFDILRSVKVLCIFILFFFTIYCVYKSRGLGQAKPEPSRVRRLWLGLEFEKAKAGSGQAKAGAFRPSRAVHSPI